MNSQMTDLAFAGKCGFFGASGSTAEPEAQAKGSVSANRDASASKPKPLPARARNLRREENLSGIGSNK